MGIWNKTSSPPVKHMPYTQLDVRIIFFKNLTNKRQLLSFATKLAPKHMNKNPRKLHQDSCQETLKHLLSMKNIGSKYTSESNDK